MGACHFTFQATRDIPGWQIYSFYQVTFCSGPHRGQKCSFTVSFAKHSSQEGPPCYSHGDTASQHNVHITVPLVLESRHGKALSNPNASNITQPNTTAYKQAHTTTYTQAHTTTSSNPCQTSQTSHKHTLQPWHLSCDNKAFEESIYFTHKTRNKWK